MQLDAFLRSLRDYARSLYGRIAVLYRVTTPKFAESYAELRNTYREVVWKQESVFAEDLRALVTAGQWTVFHTDDDVFFRPPEVPDLREDEVCYSLRLG